VYTVSLSLWQIPVAVCVNNNSKSPFETHFKLPSSETLRLMLVEMGKLYDGCHSRGSAAFNYQSEMSCFVHAAERLAM